MGRNAEEGSNGVADSYVAAIHTASSGGMMRMLHYVRLVYVDYVGAIQHGTTHNKRIRTLPETPTLTMAETLV